MYANVCECLRNERRTKALFVKRIKRFKRGSGHPTDRWLTPLPCDFERLSEAIDERITQMSERASEIVRVWVSEWMC